MSDCCFVKLALCSRNESERASGHAEPSRLAVRVSSASACAPVRPHRQQLLKSKIRASIFLSILVTGIRNPCSPDQRGALGNCCAGMTASSAGAGRVSAGSGQRGSAGLGGAGNASGGAGSAGAGTCDPKPVGGWTPAWTPPLAPTPGVCTAQQVSAEIALCSLGGTSIAMPAMRLISIFQTRPVSVASLPPRTKANTAR
jgi:hypothetical protein